MRHFFEELKKRVQVWHERRAQRIEAARQAELDAEARRRVQVMEFNGELFVSVDGVPLLDVSDINGMLPGAVANARRNFKDWREETLFSNS